MLYRAHLQLFLVFLLAAGIALAQSPADIIKPLSKSDVFVALETAREGTQDLIEKTNAELIAAIKVRGVDFVLTPEEEWQLGMRNASEDLLAAIRKAVDPVEREARVNANRQQRLYTEFAAGYNANDLTSRRAALVAAREFVSLYSADQNVAEIITFMQRNLPRLEQSVSMMEQREAAIERARAESIERQQRMDEQRLDRERRRAEANAANAAANGANRSTPNAPGTRADTKEEAPPARQPSDPGYRTPRYPIRRP